MLEAGAFTLFLTAFLHMSGVPFRWAIAFSGLVAAHAVFGLALREGELVSWPLLVVAGLFAFAILPGRRVRTPRGDA